MKDDRLHLSHISECIAQIERYTEEGEAQFFQDKKAQDAVEWNVWALAQSTRQLSLTPMAKHSNVDWRATAELGEVLLDDFMAVACRHTSSLRD